VPQALDVVRQGLVDPDPVVRVNAIEVVGTTGQIRLMPQVQKLADDQVLPVRFATAAAIGDLKYQLAESTARKLLRSEDENVRVAALYAMARLGSQQSLDSLRTAINSEDQTVRANAAWLLGKSGDNSPETRRALWWTLGRKDCEDKVILQTAEAIAMLKDERVYPKLWTMLISKFAEFRIMGVRAMGALGTTEAKNAIITMLDDDLPEVRLAAAEQLGALGDTSGETVVLEIVRKKPAFPADPQTMHRINVLTALAIGRIGTQRLIRFLPELLRAPDNSVRLAAAKAVLHLEP
jgi:HEAT repeat protein